jgi:peptidoglycan/xylan/chitin deacetylase (PgdA/CDA1 family)
MTMRVALTFDAEHPDRPSNAPENVDRILDCLHDRGIRATFFVQGRWAQAETERVQRIVHDGHVVGNHSFYHARMPLLSDDGLRVDIRDAEARIREQAGVDPRPWFRCPFGAGHDDPRVLAALSQTGYRNVHWHVEAEDWEPWRTARDIADDVVAGVAQHGDGAIVLLHTWPSGTAGGLPLALDGLARLDAEFVTVAELETVS